MRLKNLLFTFLMILVLGLIIGCSSDGADTGESDTEESAATETPAQEEEPTDEEASEEDEADEGAASDGSSVGDIENEVFRQQLRSLSLTRLDEGQEYVFEWDSESVVVDEMLCMDLAGDSIGINLKGPNSEFNFGFNLNADGSINTSESNIFFEIDGEGYGSFGSEVWEFVYAEEEGPVVYGEAELQDNPGAGASTGLAVFYLDCGDQ